MQLSICLSNHKDTCVHKLRPNAVVHSLHKLGITSNGTIPRSHEQVHPDSTENRTRQQGSRKASYVVKLLGRSS